MILEQLNIHVQKMNLGFYLYHAKKSEKIRDLTVKAKTINLLDYDTGKN